jgi:hypothetical protein
LRPLEDALLEIGLEDFREDGDDVEPHRERLMD